MLHFALSPFTPNSYVHIYTNYTSVCGVNRHGGGILAGADAQSHPYCYNASQKSRVFFVSQDCFLAGHLRLPVCALGHQASRKPQKFLVLEPTRKKDDQASQKNLPLETWSSYAR